MRYRLILMLGIMLTLASCGAMLQSSGSGASGSQGSASTTDTTSVSSRKGLEPTAADVARYNDDVTAFLKAKVPNFDNYKNAALIVDNKVADNLSSVKLSKIKSITVMDRAPSMKTGDKSTKGAIVISTK